MNDTNDVKVTEPTLDLTTVFSQETVVTLPSDLRKAEVLTRLVHSLIGAGLLPCESSNDIIKMLLDRERFGTTGLGNGIALPHLRTRYVGEFVGSIGIASSEVNFDSLDGRPTRLIILLLSPFDRRERHVEIMGRLAKLLSDKTLQYSVQLPRSAATLFDFLGF